MTTTARRTRKAPATFTVTRSMRAYAPGDERDETFTVPGMVVTLPELRAMVADAPWTAQVWCDTCGESVADCPDTARLVDAPAEWSSMTIRED